jgi:putative sugar O-methyltransferase
MAETMELLNKKSIFEIVQDNLIKSQSSTYSISSTWSIAMNRRGETHLKDYENMFSPLSQAGKLMVNFVFRADLASMHDFLEMMEKFNFVESDFGNPLKRNLVSGQHYSNPFIRNVNIFKKIHMHIDESIRSKGHCVIVEIGSGLGILPYLIKQHYQDRVSLILIDIPEILSLQEFYLRNMFPKSKFVYVSGNQETYDFTDSAQIVFVNAFCIEKIRFRFDVGINTSSFAEMTKNSVDEYLSKLDKSAEQGATIISINNSGHSHDSYQNPGYYSFPGDWSLEEAWVFTMIDMLGTDEDFIGTVFKKKNPGFVEPKNKRIEVVNNLLTNYDTWGDAANEQNITTSNSIYRTIIKKYQTNLITTLADSKKEDLTSPEVINQIKDLTEDYFSQGNLFLNENHFWFQQYAVSSAVATQNEPLVDVFISYIDLIDYQTEKLVDLIYLLGTNGYNPYSLFKRLNIDELKSRNLFRLLLVESENEVLIEEFIKRLTNKKLSKNYLLHLFKNTGRCSNPKLINLISQCIDDFCKEVGESTQKLKDIVDIVFLYPNVTSKQNIRTLFTICKNTLVGIDRWRLLLFESSFNQTFLDKKSTTEMFQLINLDKTSMSYYDFGFFAKKFSEFNLIDLSNDCIRASMQEKNDEHRHLNFLGSICIKNNDIQFAKEMFHQCSIMRPYILSYQYSHKLCESMIYYGDEFYKTLLKKKHLMFQGEHSHFGDFDFLSRY